MGILDKSREILNLKKRVNPEDILVQNDPTFEEEFLKRPEVEKIIEEMPSDFSSMEKAYYVYLKLGEIFKEDPRFVFAEGKEKEDLYARGINQNGEGICIDFARAYASILKNPKIGIETKLVAMAPQGPNQHVDTVLKMDDKVYICNLISDLSNIQSKKRANSFCYDLRRQNNPQQLAFLEQLEKYFGKISHLEREEIEVLDKKIGYSLTVPSIMQEGERGIYTNDTIEVLQREFHNSELLKEYVFQGKEVSKEEELKYKLDWLFEQAGKLREEDKKMAYLENVRYHIRFIEKVLLPEDLRRITPFVVSLGDASPKDESYHLTSVLRVARGNDKEDGYWYYQYSDEEGRYLEKTKEELIDFFESNGRHGQSTYCRKIR